MNERELMTTHCDALYTCNERRELVCINDWLRRPAPAFWIGFTRAATLWRFREDVAAETRAHVERLIGKETSHPSGRLPRHHDAYCASFGAQDAVAGPTYWFSNLPAQFPHRVQRVSPANAVVLRDSELAAWVPDIPHQQPMFASVENGRAVALCASVRCTDNAHEAGVETLAQHRRRGHAAAVVAAWAQELLRHGIVPLYSTSWDNLASQGVAGRVGFEAFGWEYRIG